MSEDDDLLFQDEDPPAPTSADAPAILTVTDAETQFSGLWKMLIVDDAEEIHQVTRFALEDYQYAGHSLNLLSAYSATEAEQVLAEHQDIALVLLDVVMETTDAGLQLVKYIRETLQNPFVRIVLRTGQPGHAPEKEVIIRYEINDYKNKTELTDQKLFTLVTASLRSYEHVMAIEAYRQHLEDKVAERTQELREKNIELELLYQEKREFLRIATDNLKSPLKNIQELATMILHSFDHFSKEKVMKLMRIIDVSSQQMHKLIKNLLDANALESGTMDLSMGIYDVRPSLQFLADDYQELAKTRSVKLHVNYPAEDYKIMINKNAFLQILDNLVSSAIKSAGPGKNVYVNINRHADRIRCEIKDEGPGLSEAEQQQLFEKYGRLKPYDPKEGGLSLGLFIVKKLVDSMNGTVWCVSAVGEGTTFFVEFPLANEH